MIAILTSSLGGSYKVDGKRYPTILPNTNSQKEQIDKYWKENAKVLFISAWPNAFEINDENLYCLNASFAMSGLSISAFDVCDARSEALVKQLASYDVIILGGGHVPTQNQFFERLGLKQSLASYQGLLIAWSAGSMNCANVVYALPEAEGEGVDPHYQRFLNGLALTSTMIIPHYQALKDDIVDGLRVIEDMAIPDSVNRTFYCLVDGSYILSVNGKEEIHGEAYKISNGNIKKVNDKNNVICL